MSAAEVPETEPNEAEPQTEPNEAEPQTEPNEAEPQTEPNEPADDAPSLEAVHAQLAEREKKLEKERGLHEKRLGALFGDEWAAHVMCPLCVGDGFLTPYGPGELPAEQLDAMDALSGRYTPPEYVVDDSYEMCGKCDGYGQNVTGSKNPEHLTKICDDCGGNGYKKKLFVPQPVAMLPVNGAGAANTPQAPVSYGSSGAADQWGRPAGHVHYGIEPQFVTA